MKEAGKTALAGWAEADITPPLGFPMGGRGPRFDPAEQIADPLLAQVTLLQDRRERRLLLVSLDIIGSTSSVADPIRHQLAAIVGTTPDAVVLNYSHTHSSGMGLLDIYPYNGEKPVVIRDYETRLMTPLVGLARQVLARLAPVGVSWRNGTSEFAINRRRRNENGVTEHRPHPEGYYDPNLWLLELEGNAGSALLYSYACHPVTMYEAEWQTISADFPGSVRFELRERMGAAIHLQFFQGLAGSVRPRILADLEEKVFRNGSRDVLKKAGKQLADDLVKTLALPGVELELELMACMGYVLVRPGAPLQPDGIRELGTNWGGYWLERLCSGIPCDRVQPWPIGLIQLGCEHLITYIAAEAVAEWRPHLEKVFAGSQLACWGYCQHEHTYLPTDELIAAGGYEVNQAPLCTNFWPQPIAAGTDTLVEEGFERLRTRLERERS